MIRNRYVRGKRSNVIKRARTRKTKKNAAMKREVQKLANSFFVSAVEWHKSCFPPYKKLSAKKVEEMKAKIYENARAVIKNNLCKNPLERELFPIIDIDSIASGKKILDVISKHYSGKGFGKVGPGEVKEFAGKIFSSLARRIVPLNSVSSELSASMTSFPGIERNIFSTAFLDYNINFYKSKFGRGK